MGGEGRGQGRDRGGGMGALERTPEPESHGATDGGGTLVLARGAGWEITGSNKISYSLVAVTG